MPDTAMVTRKKIEEIKKGLLRSKLIKAIQSNELSTCIVISGSLSAGKGI